MTGDRKFVTLVVSLAVGMFVTMVTSVTVSVHKADRAVSVAIERERAASEQGRSALCLVIQTQQGVYLESPPSTPAGRGAMEAWATLALAFRCSEGN